MSEIIELKSLNANGPEEIISEEYHEISLEALLETDKMYPLKATPINEYDFFTCIDVNSSKEVTKKKKTKKTRKPKTVMDIIRNELAAKPLLVENNITIIDRNTQRTSYLEKIPRLDRIFPKRGLRILDTETGIHGQHRTEISPIFPLVLENRLNKQLNVPGVEYKEPILFQDDVAEYAKNEEQEKKIGKFLDLDIHNIKFKHHHEFSLEELLCVKATELYDTYKTIDKQLAELSKVISVNRKTRNSLKEQLLKLSPHRQNEVKFDKNVLKYTQLMIDAKYKYCDVMKNKKMVVHQVISLWEDIKMVREKCGVTTNNLMIDVKSKEFEQKEYEQQWIHLFEIEYNDTIVKIEYEYIKNYLKYKELKNEKNGDNAPKPKLKIDYDDLKAQVEEIVNEIIFGDKYDLCIKYNSDVGRYKNQSGKGSPDKNFKFKVFVDDILVCESDEYQNRRNRFDIDFCYSLSMEILPHNQTMSIILFENTEAVSHYKLQLSDVKTYRDDVEFLIREFEYDKVIEPTNKHVGSGFDIKTVAAKNKVRLKSSNLFKGKQYTRCQVFIKLEWHNKLNDYECVSIKSAIDMKQMLLRLLNGEEPRLDLLIEAINELYGSRVEDNETVTAALQNICKPVASKWELFDENDAEHSRFRLLQLRNKDGFLNMNNKCVPLLVSQFSTEQIHCLRNDKDDDLDYYKFQSEPNRNSIELQRFMGVKLVEKLNDRLRLVVDKLLLKKTYKDIVKDYGDFKLRDILSNSIKLSLADSSTFRKQQVLEECLLEEQEIYVTVIRAFNLLDRSNDDADGAAEDGSDDVAGFRVHPLRPLVRVSYHGVSAETNTAIGCYPTWNNTLKIKTRLEPLSSLHVDVYDQCKDILETDSDDRSGRTTVNYRKYNKWLGGTKIPLHTVLELGHIRGTFKLDVPPLVLGYENVSSKSHPTVMSKLISHIKRDASLLSLQITTSISYFGGLQTYHRPLPDDSDNDFIIRRLNDFITEYNDDFPTRNISLTFIDSSKRNKCVTEFVQPLPLPSYDYFPLDPRKTESARSKSSGHSKSSSSKGSRKKTFEEDKEDLDTWKTDENSITKKIEAAVRYVSLIPTYEARNAHVVTLTGEELLRVVYGSQLDHTILLASYFLHLGVRCWIVIGFGLPRGRSSYVLVKRHNDKPNEPFTWCIYDAAAGEKYIVREVGCPLRTVSYVFDCDNIWVNVQRSQECESISFDFNKSSDWQAVFSKPIFLPNTIPAKLYSEPYDVEDLRSALETKIKNKIQKWRSHVKTIWNRYWSSLLRDTLVQWEYWSFNPTQPRPTLGHRLKQLMASYKIFGFPINTSYLNTHLLMSHVKSTSLHVNDDPSVEFGLAVEVFAYPNNILSVWVFLASITRL
ncbi:putative coiled-coil and C2 domain containing 2A [Danaus plexippus plexippus]|uniref:Coiled-coil and C2 domain containing 2A n=1 Tax=Danaus plexippus plexippus TaxID=278856 RepID=A0A212EJ12_DANPL|nr:putative coiled-coil and C2 domain containing 2A [Danaus plexippus plexippus]